MNDKRIGDQSTSESLKTDGMGLPTGIALNRERAAEFISVGPPTLDRLTKRGFLNPNRATRRPLYLVDDLKNFLEDNRGCDFEVSQKGAA